MGLLASFLPGVSAAGPKPAATVVLSRIPPEEPKLQAQHDALSAAFTEAGVKTVSVQSIYDIQSDDADVLTLRAVAGDLIFMGWHYPRAIKWVLARHDMEVNGSTRKLHCLDVRELKPPDAVQKIKDILAGTASAEIKPPADAQGIGQKPPAPGQPGYLTVQQRGALGEMELAPPANAEFSPRWYPVIDYDKCTNCMDCMDFCLFGVYGVDHAGTLRTVQQDQCRQDCPACSRVCPVGAIIFPKYPTNQTIAGADGDGDRGNIKLDLSKIFGKPKARHQAALERDRELIKAGRRPASAEKIDKLAEEFEKQDI